MSKETEVVAAAAAAVVCAVASYATHTRTHMHSNILLPFLPPSLLMSHLFWLRIF